MKLKHVDDGKHFDFGKTSADYAKYRDIYTSRFYQKLLSFDIGISGQNILDLGTGTGVIPRGMYKYGAQWTGADISAEQLAQARRLVKEQDMAIDLFECPADSLPFEDNTFDVVTACSCFWYFDKATVLPEIKRVLKPGGRFAVMSMIGLPRESAILRKSEELVLKYNPTWNGCNYARVLIAVPDWVDNVNFSTETLHTFVEEASFTREAWCGRMRACRGVGASLPSDLVADYDTDHYNALCEMADETFTIPHQFLYSIFKVIK